MSNNDSEELEERIVDVDVTSEIQTSYLEYAYSVIYARALPDARDGLKPVQRRILYAMNDEGLRPDRAFVKCARVVGDVMGRLHPHGDSAIYDALVRMGQPWTMRLQLVDGHGNFGSLDAGPAAMRYTECRMAPAALAMTAGLDEDTVDFRPNYDGKQTEPSVLPAAFPNLLVNGASGIAVGMATNIPPHNLIEVVQALRHLLANPDADLDDLMRYIPGPDLPTGGKIVGLDGVREAYATGRGVFRMRATARVEQVSARRRGIVVTELPYGVGPERIIEQIKQLVQAKRLSGIADIKDLTDLTNGLRLVIEVKSGINAEALLDQLYRLTKLEESFGINSVALVDGQPRTLPLKEMLQVYLDHRLEVTLRRSGFQLTKASDRLHLVQGLLTALLDIDDVIAIIRTSQDAAEARQRLMVAFELDEVQANYILDLQLRRLTKLSKLELETERDELTSRIADLTAIVEDPARLRALVTDELAEVARSFGTPRRTVLLEGGAQVKAIADDESLELSDDPCWVMLSSTGLLARMAAVPASSSSELDRRLPAEGPRARHDVLVSVTQATTRSDFGLLTTAGRLLRGHAVDLPNVVRTANSPTLQGGTRADELFGFDKGERPLAVWALTTTATLAVGTRQGVVKRVNPELLNKDAWSVIRLAADDELVGAVELVNEDDELVFVTSDAQLLHFPASQVRPQGRAGAGIAGIKLNRGARAIWFGATPRQDAVVVTIAGSSSGLPGAQPGSVKVTPFEEYPAKGRATSGVRAHRFLRGEDILLLAWAGPRPPIAAADSGSPIDLPSATGRRDGSGTPGSQPIAAISSRIMPH